MTIKSITKELLEHIDTLGYNANVYNHKGEPIEHIIITEDNSIMLLTNKQYKRLLKERQKINK